MTVRAKFYVKSKTARGNDREVLLEPVSSPDPNHENSAFWDATPSGSIEMYINNREAADQFVVGEEYYVDFSPAPPTEDYSTYMARMKAEEDAAKEA